MGTTIVVVISAPEVPETLQHPEAVTDYEGVRNIRPIPDRYRNDGNGFSAYSSDPPDCVTTGATPSEVEGNMWKALKSDLDGMKEEGYSIPMPTTELAYLEIVPNRL